MLTQKYRNLWTQLPIEIDAFVDIKKSPHFRPRKNDPTTGDLVLDFDPKKLHETEEDGAIIWEIEDYVFQKRGEYGCTDLLMDIEQKMMGEFKERYSRVSYLPPVSEIEQEIDYRDSENE